MLIPSLTPCCSPLLLRLLCSSLSLPRGSWGGGYNHEDDSLKFKEAVTLNRRFVLLPPSWGCQLGHGPLLLMVVFRCVFVVH